MTELEKLNGHVLVETVTEELGGYNVVLKPGFIFRNVGATKWFDTFKQAWVNLNLMTAKAI